MLDAFANTFGTQPTAVQVNASDGAMLTGDALADTLSTINMNLTTGSIWTGAALNVTNVNVDASSIWNMTANSTVSQQVTNAGLIDFTPPVGGAFKTLTTINCVGAGGMLGLNTFLGTDGSPSDKLIINGGSATGSVDHQNAVAGGQCAWPAGIADA